MKVIVTENQTVESGAYIVFRNIESKLTGSNKQHFYDGMNAQIASLINVYKATDSTLDSNKQAEMRIISLLSDLPSNNLNNVLDAVLAETKRRQT